MILEASDLNTREGLIKFQTVCLAHDACLPALDWIAFSISQGWTLRECMDRSPGDRKQWGHWCRIALAEVCDEAVRAVFSEFATGDDPRLAAQFCIERNDLGFDEALNLLSKWHSAMRDDGEPLYPVIEDELARTR